MNLRCIIVDDEPLSRKGLELHIQKVGFLELIASCNNAASAFSVLQGGNVDLMFLDINMPQVSGMELLRSLHRKPMTVIVSAYHDFAVASYELDVLDYLVKPVTFERFMMAVDKAGNYYELKNNADGDQLKDFCFIKCNNSFEKIRFDEILFVQALQNYVVIHTEKRKLISYLTLKSVQEHLPQKLFAQINKSNIISVGHIDSITGNSLNIGTHSFTIGRSFREHIQESIINSKLMKRS